MSERTVADVDPDEADDAEALTLAARKDGAYVQIQVRAGEEVVFHARPHVEGAVRVFQAAMHTFGAHGWPEKYGEDADNGGDAFQ